MTRLATRFVLATLAVGVLAAFAGPAVAQTDDWGSRDGVERSRRGDARGQDAYQGPYVHFGLTVGRTDYDPNGIDSDASGGFAFAGGYRFLPWLAGEAHFQFLGGEENVEIGPVERDSHSFAFTFGPKFFPVMLMPADERPIPDNVQPYALIGIGGGEYEIDGGEEESTFLARFVLGVDFWLDEHLGLFVEGGGYAVDEDDIDGSGVFTVGAQYRF